jgi:hypothetical protein
MFLQTVAFVAFNKVYHSYTFLSFFNLVPWGIDFQFVKWVGDDSTVLRVVLLPVASHPPLEQHET